MTEAKSQFRTQFGMAPYAAGCTDDVHWVTARAETFGINGYVLVPQDHVWRQGMAKVASTMGVSTIMAWARTVNRSVNVHGGVTEIRPPWIGFHTQHRGDWWPYDYDPYGRCSRSLSKLDSNIMWSPDLVIREVTKLATQVAAIGQAWRKEQERIAGAKMARFRHLDLDF